MSLVETGRVHETRAAPQPSPAAAPPPSSADVARTLTAAVVLAGNRLARKRRYFDRCVAAGRHPHAWHLVEIDRAQYLRDAFVRTQAAVAELIAADEALDAANAAWRRAAADHGGGHPVAEEAYRRVQRAQERRAVALASCRPPRGRMTFGERNDEA